MIEISETVINVLSKSLQASGIEKDKCLRLKEKENRLTLELDVPKEEDRVILQGDRSVIIIDPGFEAGVGDASIDVEYTEDGPKIIMRSADAKNKQEDDNV